jgi:hypothetical protein
MAASVVHFEINRQRLVGHADSKVHAGYSHHELATLRSAIEKLPSLKAP